MPAIQSSFTILLKMLSIKAWLQLANLVGEVMLGTRLVEYMMSRKSETFLSCILEDQYWNQQVI